MKPAKPPRGSTAEYAPPGLTLDEHHVWLTAFAVDEGTGEARASAGDMAVKSLRSHLRTDATSLYKGNLP